jgi:hypothetical protein
MMATSLATSAVMGWLWVWRGKPEWVAARVRRRMVPAADSARWTVFVEVARHDLVSAGGFLVLGGLTAAVLNVAVPASWIEGLAGNVTSRLGEAVSGLRGHRSPSESLNG